MITLRLNIEEINMIYGALITMVGENNSEKSAAALLLSGKVQTQAEKDVSSWDGYVVNEVNSVLELLLPEAESGNIGITYDKPEIERYETGPVYDETQANGVSINVVLKFNDTIKIK